MTQKCRLPLKDKPVSYTAHGQTLRTTKTRGGRRTNYSLRVDGSQWERSASNKRKYCADVQHFLETGTLPRGPHDISWSFSGLRGVGRLVTRCRYGRSKTTGRCLKHKRRKVKR